MQPKAEPRTDVSATAGRAASARSIVIRASDGFALAATLFMPHEDQGRAIVAVGSATGVPQRYYARFASHLAAQGAPVVTFDYRGVGGSRPKSLRGFEARMRDWGERDIAGVLAWAENDFPGRDIRWVGHSYGGFGTGLAANNHLIERQLTVACSTADWRTIAGIERFKVAALLGLYAPALAHAFGYLPGRLAGGFADLPKGVVLEWGRWCGTRYFIFGDPTLGSLRHFQGFSGAVRFVSMRDDPWCVEEAVEHLAGQFGQSRERSFRWIAPSDVGGRAIGHVGYFREEFRDTLWPEAVDWLLA